MSNELIDPEVGLANCGNIEKVFYKSLGMYVKRYETIKTDFPPLTSDLETSHEYLHKMKGITATLGCEKLRLLLIEVISKIKKGNLLSEQEVHSVIELTEKTIDEIKKVTPESELL